MSSESLDTKADRLLTAVYAYRSLIVDQADSVNIQIRTEWQDTLAKLESELAAVRSLQEEELLTLLETSNANGSTKVSNFKVATSHPTTPVKSFTLNKNNLTTSGWTAPLISPNTRALPTDSPRSKAGLGQDTSPAAFTRHKDFNITSSTPRYHSNSPRNDKSLQSGSVRSTASYLVSPSSLAATSKLSSPPETTMISQNDGSNSPFGILSPSHLRPTARKRNLGEAGSQWENVEGSGSKSRRTTPSLSMTEQNTPATTDDESSSYFAPYAGDEDDICAGFVPLARNNESLVPNAATDLTLTSRDEEFARQLAAELQKNDQDVASAEASESSKEQILREKKEQEARDEQYARELQKEIEASNFPAMLSSSSQSLYGNKKSSFTSASSGIRETTPKIQQQIPNFGWAKSSSSSQAEKSLSKSTKSTFRNSPKSRTDYVDLCGSSSPEDTGLSPSNFAIPNAEVLGNGVKSGGSNFQSGFPPLRPSNGFQIPSNVDFVDLSEDLPISRPSKTPSGSFPGRIKNENHLGYPDPRKTSSNLYVPNSSPSNLYVPNSSAFKGLQPENMSSMPNSLTYPQTGHSLQQGFSSSLDARVGYGGIDDISQALTWPHQSRNTAFDSPATSIAHLNAVMQGNSMPGAFPNPSYPSSTMTGDLFPSVLQPERIPRFSGDAVYFQAQNELDYRNSLSAHHAAYYDYITNDPTKSKEEIQELLDNIGDDGDIPPENREGTPDAMTYPLMEHQKVGLAWMKRAEEGTSKGGILADDMGLGKTIQALALMVSMKSADSSKKTNLIVAPVALLSQWQREIKHKLKASHGLDSFILHGQKKSNMSWTRLKQYDVVLTTYGTLASELKSRENWEHRLEENPHMDPSRGPKFLLLHERAHWYRVICDEAQCIKNISTNSSKGACALKADFRWCLSGTPMQNNLGELHALIKFCRIRPFNDQKKFNAEIVHPIIKSHSQTAKDIAMRKLQALIKALLLRRNKKSTIDGKPILTLPDRVIEVQHSVFSEDEQAFYRALETQAQLQFNKYLRAGTVGRNYSSALVLLLRLRQACCHPFLIRDFSEGGPGTTHVDGDTLEGMIKIAQELKPEVVERILQDIQSGFECPICYDVNENPRIISPCGHDTCSECLSRLMDNANAQNIAEGHFDGSGRAKCPECRALLTTEITDLASFKKVHMPELTNSGNIADIDLLGMTNFDSDKESDSNTSDDSDSDPDSDSDASDLEDFIVSDGHETSDDDGSDDESMEEFDVKLELAKKNNTTVQNDANEETSSEYEEDDKESSESRAKGKGKTKALPTTRSKGKGKIKASKKTDKKGKGKARSDERRKRPKKRQEKEKKSLGQLKAESSRNKESKKKYMKYLKKTWETSGKIEKCMEILSSIRESDITEKTIIFSQWTSLLDLLEVPVSEEKWRFERYDGSMSAGARNDAVIKFMDDPRCNIMLVSLKAGNSGLNLTSASQVIILDPFWNPYIEEQAIDRAHRIGQQRTVTVHRLYVKETVEDRILDLQEKKRELIDGALDEKASQSIGRLGVRELASLFGIASDDIPRNAR